MVAKAWQVSNVMVLWQGSSLARQLANCAHLDFACPKESDDLVQVQHRVSRPFTHHLIKNDSFTLGLPLRVTHVETSL